METPSSTRRITRSQTKAAALPSANSNGVLLSKKFEESDRALTNSRQMSAKKEPKHQDRSALVDITNDSPIVGLAMGSLETPSSAMSKKRMISQPQCARTPGSGEALLRGQVKTLLQKVEEEAELSKIVFEDRPFFNLQGLVCSPMNLLAPTPANTPQVLNFSDGNAFPPLSSSPVSEKFLIPQMINGMYDQRKEDENFITRSLMLDFSEKSEVSDAASSALTSEGALNQGMESGKERESTDDDASSIWSIQVNVSSPINDEDEEEEGENSVEVEDEYDDPYDDDEEEKEGDSSTLDELCEGISKISVEEEEQVPKFSGKHIRFLYDSEDELQGEEEVPKSSCSGAAAASPSPVVVRLKGLPTPKGKHLRFPEESES